MLGRTLDGGCLDLSIIRWNARCLDNTPGCHDKLLAHVQLISRKTKLLNVQGGTIVDDRVSPRSKHMNYPTVHTTKRKIRIDGNYPALIVPVSFGELVLRR